MKGIQLGTESLNHHQILESPQPPVVTPTIVHKMSVRFHSIRDLTAYVSIAEQKRHVVDSKKTTVKRSLPELLLYSPYVHEAIATV
jgi:hypothetical protein